MKKLKLFDPIIHIKHSDDIDILIDVFENLEKYLIDRDKLHIGLCGAFSNVIDDMCLNNMHEDKINDINHDSLSFYGIAPGYVIINSLSRIFSDVCSICGYEPPIINPSYWWEFLSPVRYKAVVEMTIIFKLIKEYGYDQPEGKYKELIQSKLYEDQD